MLHSTRGTHTKETKIQNYEKTKIQNYEKKIKEMETRNQHTARSFLSSLPNAISLRIARALLISFRKAEANCSKASSWSLTSGICGGDLIIEQSKQKYVKKKLYQTSKEIESTNSLLVDKEGGIWPEE